MQHKLLIKTENWLAAKGKNSLSIIRQRGTFYWRLPRHPQSRSMLLRARQMQHLPNVYTFYEEGSGYFRAGYASAIAVSFFLFVTILSLLQMRVAEPGRPRTGGAAS